MTHHRHKRPICAALHATKTAVPLATTEASTMLKSRIGAAHLTTNLGKTASRRLLPFISIILEFKREHPNNQADATENEWYERI